MPTSEQAAWVKTVLGVNVDALVAAPPAGPSAPVGAAGSAPEKVGIIPIIPPLVLVGVKTLLGELTAAVTITNNTGSTLTLDTSSLKLAHGEFKTGRPKGVLKPGGDSTNFIACSTSILSVSATPVEGTIRYFVGDDKTIWSCHFSNPRILTDPLGTNSADAKIAGPNAAGIQQPPFASATHGSDGTFTFTLDGKGSPQPTPPSPDGPGTNVAASCRVTVVNQTQQTVFLRKQDNAAGGDFVTNPTSSLGPGASTQFVYAETPNSNNHNCRGTLSWDIGDPKAASWGLMWDNQKGAKNLSASFLTPDDGSFHSLDQIDQGDENVPVTFTLSSGGTAPKPGTKPTSCAILVKNATATVLTLRGSKADSGVFQTKPPATIAAGGSATVAFTGPTEDPTRDAKGSMLWDVGDPKAAAWTTAWDNPPGTKNTVEGKLDPATASFKSDATTADGDDAVAMTFTLSGGDGPKPAADDDFAPPSKSKQPTLRKGDESPDGWVEYAQRLLNKNKLGVTVNGKFDGAMEKKVKQFQGANGCQVDGVIGNETWSKLREGPKEAVGTDGRKPNTFEEKDAQARFVTERPDVTGYDASDNSYFMWVVSTGELPIDEKHATLKVTQPDGTSHTHKFTIGHAVSASPDGQGNFHRIDVAKFSQTFGLKKGIDPLACTVDAYLDDDIGGDRLTGPITPSP